MTRGAWRLSGYRVEELLGAGATGEVWRAVVPSTGAQVALKRIPVDDAELRAGAVSEAAILSALDHPHLVTLHDLRHLDDAIVLVLDLAASGTLAALLERRGRLTVGETITAIAPIGAALAYAHNAGVVHGDVSAANILFTDTGLPLLADLGVARLLGDAAPVRTTLAYADPLLTDDSIPGPASDVFMLGAVALHALTGTPAWPDPTSTERREAAQYLEQPDFAGRMRAAGVPEPVVDVIARALQVEPGERGTAADLALDLRHAGEPVAVELTAGRPRRAPSATSTGGRAESWPLEPVPRRQVDELPGSVRVPPFAGEPPLTHGRRVAPPFTTPPGARHLALRRGRPRIAAGMACVLVVLGCAGAALAIWWPFGGGDATSQAVRSLPSASRAVRPASVVPTVTPMPMPTPTPTPTPTSSARAPTRPPAVAAALATLDRVRTRAFARRDPALLAGVYANPALLARDRAMVASVVPPGCALIGLHTTFRDVRVLAREPRLRVRVTVALSPATLRCGGAVGGRTPATRSTPVVIDLVGSGGRVRIAGTHPVRAPP